MYSITTGINIAMDLVRIIEEADQVNASICPGMSTTKVVGFVAYFSL